MSATSSNRLFKDAENDLRVRLGAALRKARLARQLTQGQLAEELDTDPETISRFERGAALPSLIRLLALAEALDVTIVSLLGTASPRIEDEWEELRHDLAALSLRDRQLAIAVLRAIVEHRAT
ncbi:helix-turn-helix domain-containing protein [Pseudorhodoferax sp.]|uniref:helix-turn-helix domain-containing protein n=1 Tax=Pseudorhodoferax sp. TaxID=1993553 RepID=UPI0039E27AE0